MAANSPMRVREILASLSGPQKAQLKKLLPKAALPIPAAATERYPAALLKVLGSQGYSILGIVAEEILRLPAADITMEALVAAVKRWVPSADTAKVQKSKTTAPFLDALRATRTALEGVLRADGPLTFEEAIQKGPVVGHPDMRNRTQIFEVKLTGQLKTNWLAFLFQVFAYGALCDDATDLYLVLPLQKTVWHANIRTWTDRAAFLAVLQDAATYAQTTGATTALMAAALRELYSIGVHAPKAKSLAGTIAALGDFSKPYQIFLGGPTNSKMTITDAELALAAEAVQHTGARVFVHSQYIINLCAGIRGGGVAEDWSARLLESNLRYTAAIGGRGVVVHVGKSTTQPLEEALAKMRSALMGALPYATAECPILLETPAGQGTETLKDQAEFIEFVRSFCDPRIRICVDTCHVFACGHDPLAYLEAITATDPDLLRLVHFNDSQEACGSCLDRHAYIGTGKIGMERMTRLAEFCSAGAIPMVIE